MGDQVGQSSVEARLQRLSRGQRAQLLRRLREREAPDGPWLASPVQHGIWLHEQMHEGTSGYNNPAAIRLTGTVDESALRRALDAVQRRHELLRSRHDITERGLEGSVCDGPVPFRSVSADGVTQDQRHAHAHALLAAEVSVPFDVALEPPWRVLFVRADDETSILLLTLHHLVSDGWSLGVLVDDLRKAYVAALDRPGPVDLPPIPVRLATVLGDEQRHLAERRDDLVRYWRTQLADAPQAVPLPADRGGAGDGAAPGRTLRARLEGEPVTALHRWCRASRTTPFVGSLAVFALLLSQLTGEEDLVVTTPVATRQDPATHSLVACLLNTVPLRFTVDATAGRTDVLTHVRDVTRAAMANGALPFPEIVRAAGAVDPTSPISNVMFLHNNAPAGAGSLGPLRAERYPLDVPHVRYDWAFMVAFDADVVDITFEYRSDRFSDELAADVLGSYVQLMTNPA